MTFKNPLPKADAKSASAAIAKTLQAYMQEQKELARAIAKQPKKKGHKKVSKPRGTYNIQMQVLKSIYAHFMKIDAFSKGGGDLYDGPYNRAWLLKQMSAVIREGFRTAYGDQFEAKRQRRSVWASVIKLAWSESVQPAGFVTWLVRKDGIESAATIWSASKPAN